MRGILGFRQQGMNGAARRSSSATVYVTALNPGDTSWTCPATGYYTITARGAGATHNSSGAPSAGASQKTELIRYGEVVLLSIGRASYRSTSVDGQDTTVTFPSGHVMVAGGGKTAGTPGTAAGGDLNVSGLVAPGAVGGASPSIGTFASSPATLSNLSVGAGVGSSSDGSSTANSGGSGVVYIQSGKVPRIL